LLDRASRLFRYDNLRREDSPLGAGIQCSTCNRRASIDSGRHAMGINCAAQLLEVAHGAGAKWAVSTKPVGSVDRRLGEGSPLRSGGCWTWRKPCGLRTDPTCPARIVAAVAISDPACRTFQKCRGISRIHPKSAKLSDGYQMLCPTSGTDDRPTLKGRLPLCISIQVGGLVDGTAQRLCARLLYALDFGTGMNLTATYLFDLSTSFFVSVD
jgi:hypothetical protein